MSEVVSRVSNMLSIVPPPMGGLDPEKYTSPIPGICSHSPILGRGGHSPVPGRSSSPIPGRSSSPLPRRSNSPLPSPACDRRSLMAESLILYGGRRELECDRNGFCSGSTDRDMRLELSMQSSLSDPLSDRPPVPPRSEGHKSQSPLPIPRRPCRPVTPPPSFQEQQLDQHEKELHQQHQQELLQQQLEQQQQQQNEQQSSVYCEIVIPGIHTGDRPVLAKSRSDSYLPVAEDSKRREGRERFMTSKFDQRLEEAGLLKLPKHRHTSDDSFLPPSSCLSSSTEDLMADSKDPGYAKLVILSSAGPVCPLPSEKESGEQWQEEDYANPVDALKSNCQVDQAKFIISPSPPSSPPIPDIPSSCPLDAYQSVDEVRMMREKQLKEKEFDGVKLREKDKHSKKGGSRAEASGSHDFSYFQYDDNPGYSKPFDALPEPRNRLPSADSKRSPPTTAGGGGGMLGLRVNSSEKVCKEPSARFLHHVKSGPLPGGHFGGSHSLFRTPNSSPNMSTVGLDHSPMSHGQGSIPDGSPKSGNQSSTTLNPSTHVNRYILKVGDKQAESKDLLSRGETGRTSSVDSALRSHTPAKITKLRNGKDRVAVIPGKFSESKKN